MAGGGIYLKQLELGPMQNFVYLVGDPVARACVVVDPAWEIDTIVDTAAADGMTITGALVTHTHQDHVGGSLASWGMPGRIPGVEELLERVPARIYVHKVEREFLPGLGSDLVKVDNHDTLGVGRLTLTFLHTPGHTPGSTSYHVHEVVVTGDTMFVNGCGRCDFVGGDPDTMYRTLHGLIDTLPGSTVMYPGHNYGPTPIARLDEQLATNPYLKLPTLADFVAHRMAGKTPGTFIPPPAWPPPEGRPKR